MKLELMDINRFIEQRKILQVKSTKIEGRGGKLDSEGFFSEEIFGRVGSPGRKTTFGYIDLNVQIIHPEIWDLLLSLNPAIGKIILGKKRYYITEKGDLEPSDNEFYGLCGIRDLIENWDKLNLNIVGKKHPDRVKFFKKNRNRVFIDKILVLPAGIRDIQMSKTTNKKLLTSSEINKFYEELLQQTKTVDPSILNFLDDETIKNIVNAIQRKVIEINNWIRERMRGKGGILRGGLLSKSIDYTARANIVGDPNLKVGYIGIPWQVLLKLYEPFVEYQILRNEFNAHVKELIKDFLNLDHQLEVSDLKRFIIFSNEQPDGIPATLTDELIRIVEEIVKDKMILYKRDPVVGRNSYLSGFIRVDRNSFVIKLNPLDTVRMGADFDRIFTIEVKKNKMGIIAQLFF